MRDAYQSQAWNYPNPFNPRTTIALALARPATVSLAIHDARGHLVRTLSRGEALAAGDHRFTWTGRNDAGHRMPSGVYFYLATTNGKTAVGRMVLLQ